MARSRSAATRIKDIRALELRRRGLNYSQVAAEMGYRSQSSAYEAVQRALADSAREPADEVRRIEAERLDELTRHLNRVLVTRHYTVTQSGKIVTHPETGLPLLDDGPVIQAVAGLVRIAERRAKLLGLDAPTKHEVITMDAIEAEIRKLEAQVGDAGRAEAGAPPVSP